MSAAPPANSDELIASLANLTGLAPAEVRLSNSVEALASALTNTSQAEQYLAAANWNLEHAGALYFDDTQEQDDQDPPQPPATSATMADSNDDKTPDQSRQQPGGGRTLGGAYVPPSASSSSSARQPAASRQPQRGVAGLRTLGDLQSSGGGHAHADDDDDSDDDGAQQDFFAGGEKSGLAVQNPNQTNPRDHINSILRRAREYVSIVPAIHASI